MRVFSVLILLGCLIVGPVSAQEIAAGPVTAALQSITDMPIPPASDAGSSRSLARQEAVENVSKKVKAHKKADGKHRASKTAAHKQKAQAKTKSSLSSRQAMTRANVVKVKKVSTQKRGE